MLPVPTVAQLAAFTGRPQNTFGPFAAQALIQATLLFSISTTLTDLPGATDQDQLALNAIMEMADRLYLEQPYAAEKARPYTSETTLDYSYSKGSVAAKARGGQPTGLLWWDLAVQELTTSGRLITASGAIAAGLGGVYEADDGSLVIVGPDQLDLTVFGGDINAELNPRPALGG